VTLIIGITGGSASGKTRLARTLQAQLERRKVVLICEDDYYLDAASQPGFDPVHFNFDEPAAKDHALLVKHLETLRAGQGVDVPIYDYATHSRRPDRRRVDPCDIVLVEGLHLLCTPELRSRFDFSAYVSAGDDIRMDRRVARDVAERSRTAKFARDQFETHVRPMHDLHVEPQKTHADLVVRNTGAPDFEVMARRVLDAFRIGPASP
jgi:uridine kinase